MPAYTSFKTAMASAYENLDAAIHSVSYCHHLMQIDPNDSTIQGYENALEYEKAAREQIGRINAAELNARSRDACI